MARQSQPVPKPPLILLTRPQAQSDRFAAALRQALGGIDVVIAPLMAARFLRPEVPPQDWRGIILTSETGAEAARQLSAAGVLLPAVAYCVGDRTAAAAQGAGFDAQSANGDAAALVADLQRRNLAGPLLHLHGEHRRGDIAEKLTIGRIETVSLVCYEQECLPPSPDLIAAMCGQRPVILPLFSPRSAGIFATVVAGSAMTAPLWVVAMSAAVVQGLGAVVPDRLMIAAGPEAGAMLAACLKLLGRETGS